MTEKVMRALDQDELAFVEALNAGDESAMIAIFVGLNGTRTLDSAEYVASKAEPEPAPTDFDALAEATVRFVEAWKANPASAADALHKLVDETPTASKSATVADSTKVETPAPLPASTQARERTRARQIAPDVRFTMLPILEEIRDMVNDNACRIANERYGGFDRVGIFAEDTVANEIIVALSDYFGIQPDLNQLASEYHVRWFYDLEYDYSKKTNIAYAADGRTVVARDVLGEPDSWDPAQATGKADPDEDK